MSDEPSSILLTREQSTGSNTNLWGGYLITTQRQTEQAAKGYQTLAVTANATISWTNYSTGNIGQCAHLKLTGALAGAVTLTFPNYQNIMMVHNTAGATVTIMCSGGTGVAIPNSRRALIYCDGTDYFTDTPTWTGDSTTLTNNGDLVSNLQMSQAIAATAGILNGFVLTSSTATQAQYLDVALTASATSGISITKINAGTSSEALELDTISKFGLVLQSTQSSNFNFIAGNIYPVDCSAGIITATGPASASLGDAVGFIINGPYQMAFAPNGLNTNGSTSTIYLNGDQTVLVSYGIPARGWC